MANAASQRILQNQLKAIKKTPVKGFAVDLPDDSNIYEWKVFIEGPGGTEYEGGIFQGILSFPYDYPYSPPTLKFTSDFWHPNVYKDGKVCISILHPPGDDPMSGERPEERWLPTQTPETILLSVISLLADPNFSSPANVDASVELRKNKSEFQKRIKKLVEKSLKELPKDFEMPKEVKYVPEREITVDYYNDDDEDYVVEEDDGDDFSAGMADANSEDEEEDEEDA